MSVWELSFGELSIGEMSFQELFVRGAALRELSIGELSVLKCLRGTVRQGKIRRGTVLEPLRLPKTNTSRYVTQAVSFKGSILWNTVPNRYKNVESLDKFILQIKMWKPTTCTWELCKACQIFIFEVMLFVIVL